MRTNLKYWLIAMTIIATSSWVEARNPDTKAVHGLPTPTTGSFRTACVNSTSYTDLDINNVRAHLLGAGDFWWDLKNGQYVVPKVAPGVPEVSSIFAGGVWIGGLDKGGNLKVAATMYRTSGFDYFPGPLDPDQGTTDLPVCQKWDKHFTVYGKNIDKFIALYKKAPKDASGRVLDPNFIDQIPVDVKGWPGKGNPYFAELRGFELPNTDQGLAYFWNSNKSNDTYDPMEGDYPIIEVRGCPKPQYADQMIFSVYNDEGGGAPHTMSKGKPIRMEVQAQAFAYASNDELNNMTFTAYKLINRASEDIDSMFFAMWVDADLGCSDDDYIGSDTTRNLMYIYNQDALDGTGGGTSCNGVNTYADKIPILGVDYFRGPLDPDKLVKNPITGELEPKEIGMSSFMYFNRAGGGSPAATTDPASVEDFYNYLNAVWKDGTPLTIEASGYNPGNAAAKKTKYAFYDAPDKPGGWSMYAKNLPAGDRRTLQASGPFRLTPGAVNELIIGAPWVPDQEYPGPSLREIQNADDIAQDLFNRCFDIIEGPAAPDMDIIELDQEVVMALTNDATGVWGKATNGFELFEGESAKVPPTITGNARNYYFEGYKIYQLSGPTVGTTTDELSDPSKARLIEQVDAKNGATTLYNWVSEKDPLNTSSPVWRPVERARGKNEGIKHTFKVTEDQFATANKRLINHKKYYFTVLAYAYNNFANFDKTNAGSPTGQATPYLAGRRNIQRYVAIPRPVLDKQLNANYGDGAIITRIDGIGAGNNFLDLSKASVDEILAGTNNGTLVYKPGRGPINVKIYNPLEVKDGKFELTFLDENMTNLTLDKVVTWRLKNIETGKTIESETTIDKLNEQIIAEYGFSIGIAQFDDVATKPNTIDSNGLIGGEIEYADANKPAWFIAATDQNAPFHFIKTNPGEVDNLPGIAALDPKRSLSSKMLDGQFYPYLLCDWRALAPQSFPSFFFSPAWSGAGTQNANVRQLTKLNLLNNVDIIFTADKSKWSRCMVMETGIPEFYTGFETKGKKKNMDLRGDASVDKEGKADGTNTTGLGWFPGYAINVETGKRVNIFFGENSIFSPEQLSAVDATLPTLYKQTLTGGDMLWNPTSETVAQIDAPNGNVLNSSLNFPAGGHHYIYVTDQDYDECAGMVVKMKTNKAAAFKNITWCSMAGVAQGAQLLPISQGLIPNETTIKLRVDNPYQTAVGTNAAKGYPTYQFTLEGKGATDNVTAQIDSALNLINVVPNPYYAYSAYETSQFSNVVKITNLPAKCVVTIYSLDGKYIRQYKRDEVQGIIERGNKAVSGYQVSPAIEWDLKNAKGIPVASGTYLIHVSSDKGERTIKWFGVQRPYDPSGL
jgi:hypothetical protein